METIAPTAEAVNRILRIDEYNLNGCLRLIGAVTDETVTIQQPKVHVDGTTLSALDPNNADHWMDLKYDGDTFVLDANNTSRGFPFRGVWLVKKSAGTSSAEFGVEYV